MPYNTSEQQLLAMKQAASETASLLKTLGIQTFNFIMPINRVKPALAKLEEQLGILQTDTLSTPTVLRNEGLVMTRREGKRIYYDSR